MSNMDNTTKKDKRKKSRWDDPEYRKQHSEKMKKVQADIKLQKISGIILPNTETIIQQKRMENDLLIVSERNQSLDWKKFKYLIDHIPRNCKRGKKKTPLQPKDRLHFEVRDKGVCYICGSIYHYGSCNVYAYRDITYKLSHLHHIIPNGNVSDNNIVTLCTHCHQLVHQAMYISGKWGYGRPL